MSPIERKHFSNGGLKIPYIHTVACFGSYGKQSEWSSFVIQPLPMWVLSFLHLTHEPKK